MGRQKIVIKKIEDKQRKSVTFCKRREGLFKKAETASKMFGAQIGIITFSPAAGKPFVFSTTNSSSLDSIIDRFIMSSASSSPSSMLVGHKRSRSSDGDDHQFHETEKKKNHKKHKTMMMDTTTITIPGEEEKDKGFQWNFDSDQTDDQVLRNEIMGFGGNVMNQRIVTEEMLLALQDDIEDETLDVATTSTVDDNDYFDFSTLLSPPVASSSELFVEGNNYYKPPDAELQEIHPNSSNVCEYVDHDDDNGMSLLPPPMSTTTTTTSSCNWRSHMNEEEEEEVGGSDEDGLTSVVCNPTSIHV